MLWSRNGSDSKLNRGCDPFSEITIWSQCLVNPLIRIVRLKIFIDPIFQPLFGNRFFQVLKFALLANNEMYKANDLNNLAPQDDKTAR